MKEFTPQSGRMIHLAAKAAEWAVASKLALLDHVPMFPAVDTGYDIMLENGLRLQVKCSRLRVHSKGFQAPGYGFALRRGAWFSNEKRYRRTSLRPYSDVADFFVLWGIDENRFFILPTLGAGQQIWFTHRGYESKSRNRQFKEVITAKRLAEMEDRWDLLDVTSASAALIESATISNTATTDSPVKSF